MVRGFFLHICSIISILYRIASSVLRNCVPLNNNIALCFARERLQFLAHLVIRTMHFTFKSTTQNCIAHSLFFFFFCVVFGRHNICITMWKYIAVYAKKKKKRRNKFERGKTELNFFFYVFSIVVAAWMENLTKCISHLSINCMKL